MNKKKILIIEDDKDLSEMYRSKLEKESYNVSLAGNGSEALENLKNNQPDLILLDLIMPKMNGFDFIEQMQKDDKIKDIPVIVLSSLSQYEDKELAKNLGAKEYIVKSELILTDLPAKVNKYL